MVPKQEHDENNNDVYSMAPLANALPALPVQSGPVVHAGRPYPGPYVQSAVHNEQYNTQLRLLNLIIDSGYDMIQCNGQRRTGPPKNWKGPPPGKGCEIFIGKIPRDLYEDELFPLLTQFGKLYELRLMMDFSGTNRGFGFAQFSTREEARNAAKKLDGHPIRPGKYLGVMKSLDNRRLFVGGLPKEKNRDEIMEELSKLVSGIVNVILYSSVVDKTKNRGFAFVEFESHRVAAIARRKMIPGGVVLWDHELAVDWAEPEPEVAEDIMSKSVKVLYMRNLMLHTSESMIKEVIETVGQIPKAAIEKVKKLKDFAFLHFTDRHYAEQALPRLNNIVIEGATVTVVWAKPPRDRVQVKGRSLSHDSLTHSDDDASLNHHRGRPILPCDQSVSPMHVFPSPHPYYDTLVLLSGQAEPKVDITSWTSPTNGDSLMFLARLTVPFVQPPYNMFTGNYAPTPQGALNSAAECVIAWLSRNGVPSTPCVTQAVNYYCPQTPSPLHFQGNH
ncbi:probable RNA-binding protein 46 [Thrips palmi]|uniref:Probable RNA-binding protein 46 n=1 Tax=Thrips palmi TaxID=161013 RepID=A0A6P8Z0M7_THRPL|nr:probable RNA-binding protein 46 [Thrips palmi]